MIQYLSIEDVIRIHDSLVSKFGGIQGIRDRSLLESSIANPMMCVFGQEMYPTISRNHPFLDGNKRTATTSTLIFLRLNGKIVNYDENDLLEFVVLISQGKVEKEQISLYFEKICI